MSATPEQVPATPGDHAANGRSPEVRRADLDELREDLGDTVEALARRIDVPARVQARREEVTAQAKEQLHRAQEVLEEKAPPVGRAVREQPGTVTAAVAAVLVAAFVASRIRRRRAS